MVLELHDVRAPFGCRLANLAGILRDGPPSGPQGDASGERERDLGLADADEGAVRRGIQCLFEREPGPPQIRDVAMACREALADVGLVGWPKTSGSRGIHVNVRIERRWTYPEVRRAALALARDVEARMPGKATSKWWKEERQGVFLDYNQNAKDRTVASAYSVRPLPDARVSTPLSWDEVPTCEPEAFTIATVPQRFADIGDPGAGIDDADAQPVGVRVLACLDDLPHPEETEVAVGVGHAEVDHALDLQRRDGESPRDLLGRSARLHVLAQPAQRDAHQNCLSRRGSLRQSSRRSGIPWRSTAIRSSPQPNANPVYRSAS